MPLLLVAPKLTGSVTASKPCYETGISAAPSAAAGRDEPESGKRKVAKWIFGHMELGSVT